jgi:hypothetical protein
MQRVLLAGHVAQDFCGRRPERFWPLPLFPLWLITRGL